MTMICLLRLLVVNCAVNVTSVRCEVVRNEG